MLIRVDIDPDQIRWYCQSAIGSFETLDTDEAIDSALHDLRAILAYLDGFPKSIAVDDARPLLGAADRETWVSFNTQESK